MLPGSRRCTSLSAQPGPCQEQLAAKSNSQLSREEKGSWADLLPPWRGLEGQSAPAEAVGRPPSDQRVLCPSAVPGQEEE